MDSIEYYGQVVIALMVLIHHFVPNCGTIKPRSILLLTLIYHIGPIWNSAHFEAFYWPEDKDEKHEQAEEDGNVVHRPQHDHKLAPEVR